MRCCFWAIGLLAATVGKPVTAAWLEARTGHFTVYSEGSDASIRAFATRLEAFDAGLRRLRQLPDRPEDRANPLNVYVVADVAAVQRLCNGGGRRSKGCTGVYGFYGGSVEGSRAFTPRNSGRSSKFDLDADTVLYHEYSHHFMFQNYAAAYPAWFVEGFAEFNAAAVTERDGALGFGRAALHRYHGLYVGATLKVSALMTAEGAKLSLGQRDALYGRGWLLTHYLTFEKARKGQLSAYLRGVNDGKPSLDAARAAFGDLDALDRELDAYLRRRKLSYYRVEPQQIEAGAVTVRALTPGEAAVMPVRLRSKRGVDKVTAFAVAVDARRLAAPFPNDAGAQNALAEAEFDAGNDEAAEAAADRTLAAAPADRTAMLYKGRVLMRRAAGRKVTDAATWKAVRIWFARANRLEPNHAEPLLLFYQSFMAQGIKPTTNAATGLERAFDLVPQDAGLRFLLARQYVIDGKASDARTILAPLAYSPHAGEDNPAKRIIALIDAGDTSGLTAALASASTAEVAE